jgi:hypothetical protein
MTGDLEADGAPIWTYDTRQQAQQRAFTDTIPADDPNRFTAIDFQGNVFERPEWRLSPKPAPPSVGDSDILQAY